MRRSPCPLPRRGPTAALRLPALMRAGHLRLVPGGALCAHVSRWLLRPVADLAALHACRNRHTWCPASALPRMRRGRADRCRESHAAGARACSAALTRGPACGAAQALGCLRPQRVSWSSRVRRAAAQVHMAAAGELRRLVRHHRLAVVATRHDLLPASGFGGGSAGPEQLWAHREVRPEPWPGLVDCAHRPPREPRQGPVVHGDVLPKPCRAWSPRDAAVSREALPKH